MGFKVGELVKTIKFKKTMSCVRQPYCENISRIKHKFWLDGKIVYLLEIDNGVLTWPEEWINERI